MQATISLTLNAESIKTYFQTKNWRDAAALRTLLSDIPASHTLGYFTTEDLACLIVSATEEIQRSIVVLNHTTLVTFDVIAGGKKASWALSGDAGNLHHTGIPFSNGTSDQVLINVVRENPSTKIETLSNLDLAGVRIGEFAVLSFVDLRAGRSAVFFDSNGGDKLKILIAGLAPGIWEVWRNGWLDEPRVLVTRDANALYYEGRPGGYFLKRTS